MNDVIRAPLVPSDSFETWTRTVCPCGGGLRSARPRVAARSSSSSTIDSASPSSSAPASIAPARSAEVGRVVARVEEGVLGEPDVDERRLHARQDVRHDALVDAAHDRAVAMPLEIELGEEVTFLDCDPRFGEARIDDDPFAHGSTSPTRPPASYMRVVRVSLELPHSYREEEAKRHEGDEHRGATVAHQR